MLLKQGGFIDTAPAQNDDKERVNASEIRERPNGCLINFPCPFKYDHHFFRANYRSSMKLDDSYRPFSSSSIYTIERVKVAH